MDNKSDGNPIDATLDSPIKSYVHVYRDGFCGRGNTTYSYNELNRYVSKIQDERVSIYT
jgi:translation initiation factor eIF-2B subunit gamma